MTTIADRADFSGLRYASVWEDADVLAEALAVRPGARVLSIASAGDNALALLADDPAEVVAVDLSAAQLHAVRLRVAAFRTLAHGEVLELLGARPSPRRADLYRRARLALEPDARRFWDARPADTEAGAAWGGRFERYFRRFRQVVLPLTQSPARVRTLLALRGTTAERREWYDGVWDSWRWRALFRVAASRAVLGRARDPRFFDHVEGRVADRLAARVRAAVTATPPADNPYLHAVLTGTYDDALPRYLRPEHFDAIRDRLGRLTLRQAALEHVLDETEAFDALNLSDLFEYLSPDESDALFARLADATAPGGRLAYWNLLADRRPGPHLTERLRPLDALAARLHGLDKAPFYSAFRVDERVGARSERAAALDA